MRPQVPLTFRLMLTIRCLFQACTSDGAYLLVYFSYAHLCTCVSLLWVVCAGKSRKGKLVHWVERASFRKIQRFLEISEQEQHHEVLLTVKNLHDLSRHPTPYSVSIILHPLASEIVEGEHFVTADLLNLIPDSLSLARESETEAACLELAVLTARAALC